MKQLKELFGKKALHRRSFLKYTGISSVGLSLGFPFFATWGRTATVDAAQTAPSKPVANWKTDSSGNRYFVPTAVRTDAVNDKQIVTARVDGLWRSYAVREFSDEFHDWWLEEKVWYYEQLLAFFEGQTDELRIPNGGHHHPMLSTYGRVLFRRGDSDFHLNTAVKGFALLPKPDKIKYVTDKVQEVYDAYAAGEAQLPNDLFNLRRALYLDKTLWDKTRFATLELYSGRPINDDDQDGNYGFSETHTFQNLIVNPQATLSYMSLYNTAGGQSYYEGLPELTPHHEFRGICWLISYFNPNNTPYEQEVADYINKAHSGYHGGADDIATNVFLIVEQFNNTPTYGPGRGKRVVPTYDYKASALTTTLVPPQRRKLSFEEKCALIKRLRIPV